MSIIRFLPEPRRVQWNHGQFRLRKDTTIALNHLAPEQVFHVAEDLQRFVERAKGLRLPMAKLSDTARETNVICFEFAPPASAESMESYQLTIAPERIRLKASTPLGLLWAERTLRQMLSQTGNNALPCAEIEDAPLMRFRGVMLDVSRSKVPTLETLFGIVKHLSSYKLNAFQLYIEHTFAFRHHPLIGAGCGALTSEDILRLDAHCRRFGVELIPSLQSFGHMYHVLKLPPYQQLSEVPPDQNLIRVHGRTITPTKEESYKLLEEMFDDFLPSFSSGFCNVNCDETYDLGKGLSKAEAERIGVGRVYLNHILRLHQIVTGKHGKRMMMWGDIILHHPELVRELPKDIIVLNWGYDAAHPFGTAKTFADSGLSHWICPGTSSWNTIFPRINNACANIRGFTAAGIEHKATGMLNTDWGDGGHYNLQGLSWHGYLFGGECAWSGPRRDDRAFDDAFGRLFFGKGGGKIARAIRQLGTANDDAEMNLSNQSRSMHMLFNHPEPSNPNDKLAPLTLATLRRVQRVAESVSKTFAAALKQRGSGLNAATARTEILQTLLEHQLAADLLSFAARKTLLLKCLPTACHSERSEESLPSSAVSALRRLISEQRKLVARFKKLWLARSKPEGIEEALNRFAAEERYLLRLARGGK